MSEGCNSVFSRLSNFGFLTCIGFNPNGIKENPEDVVNVCYFPEDAIKHDSGNPRVGEADHEKRLFKWSMTVDEARLIAENLVKAAEGMEDE